MKRSSQENNMPLKFFKLIESARTHSKILNYYDAVGMLETALALYP
jgi:hypothetical protein